ncbi:class I SAM-dependent methyltransferase [Frigoriflavimonas asaccharolytica]|uniref:SAM-dependent methyltransferase n=1 Tax=Frigoriflavimonas asaccharolytica TaxID=2735899 RepID=A0A8J8K7X2_9FLAO|nr:methyltransferase domain-containing protein [Frigoriflavimonas asaccharolytica]NRS91397.1 SAM-dependent methyltransferase [Frigoriflavimonas asaccharolytica]
MLPFYTGNSHECNLCGTKLKTFATLENGEKICPICGSIPRTRRLYMLLNSEFLKANGVFLDFSPLRIMYKNLKERKDINYFPSDFENEFLADYHFDITNIETENEKFDVIVCYHILKHIIKDEKAMRELYRVLKNDGVLLIQTPFKHGEIYEYYTKTSKQERENSSDKIIT